MRDGLRPSLNRRVPLVVSLAERLNMVYAVCVQYSLSKDKFNPHLRQMRLFQPSDHI